MVGGYKIIDFKHTNFQLNTPAKVEGVYEAVVKSKKTTMLTNLKYMGMDITPFIANFDTGAPITSKTYVGVGKITITITSDDEVTVHVVNEG